MDFVFGIDFLICISSFTILSLNQNLNSKFLITRSRYKTLNFGVNSMSFYKMIILIKLIKFFADVPGFKILKLKSINKKVVSALLRF